MPWNYLSEGLLVSTTAAYILATLAFSGEFALTRSLRPRLQASPAAIGRSLATDDAPPASPIGLPRESADKWRRRREQLARIGVGLAVLGLVLHAGVLIARSAASGRAPLGSMFEFALAASFAAVAAFLIVGQRTGQLRRLGLLAMFPVAITMVLSLATMYSTPQILVPALRSVWLNIHVGAAAIGIGALTVGAASCVVQLKAERRDEHSAATADAVARASFAFAFPVWTFAVATGAIWAEYAWGRYWGWDPKEIWALISWIVLAAYLHSRRTGGMTNREVAAVGLIAYGTLLFNFIGVNIWFNGLHSYAGL